MRIAYIPFPYWDQWGALSTSEYLSNLFHQHNEHRLVVFKLIGALDAALAHGTFKINFAVSLLLQALQAGLLVALAYWAGLRRWSEILWVSAIAFGFLFWAGQWENFFWAFQTQFFGVYLFATLAFVLLAAVPSWGGIVLSACAALMAVGFMSNGVVVPVLLLSLAVCLRRSWVQVGVLAVASLTMIGVYLIDYHSVSGHSNPIHSLGQPHKIAFYIFTYLGNPSGELFREMLPPGLVRPDNIAVPFGIAAVVGVLWAFILLVMRPGAATAPRLVLVHIILFVGATSFLTALGRLDFGLLQALASRYATPALVLWISLIILLWSLLANSLWSLLIPASATISLALMVATGGFAKTKAWEIRFARDGAATAALAQVRDDVAFKEAFPFPNFVAERIEVLKTNKLGVFASPWADWLGTPLQSHVLILPTSECIGSFDQAVPVSGNPAQTAYRVNGWAWLTSARRAPKRVILTNADNVVVGYAFTDASRPDVRAAVSIVRQALSGWRGHAKLSGAGEIKAFALMPDDDAACPIGVKNAH